MRCCESLESATQLFQTNPNGLCQAAQERLPFLLSGLGRGSAGQRLAMAGTGRAKHPPFATRQPQHVHTIFAESFLTIDAFDDGARVAMVQAQDVLGLGSEARMNIPGVADGQWRWRLGAGALTDSAARNLAELVELSGRKSS